jgi:hypothetical protein
VGAETGSDFKRFQKEMAALGIAVEWRVIERSDQEFHDRFMVTKGKAWNVPPVNTLYKGDESPANRVHRKSPVSEALSVAGL